MTSTCKYLKDTGKVNDNQLWLLRYNANCAQLDELPSVAFGQLLQTTVSDSIRSNVKGCKEFAFYLSSHFVN